MKFGPVQQNRFGTADGAYSSVTDTEFSGTTQILYNNVSYETDITFSVVK